LIDAGVLDVVVAKQRDAVDIAGEQRPGRALHA
jgi:hypothetical protein